MKRLCIIGSGDLGIQLAHHAKAIPGLEAVGFIDDFQTPGAIISGLPVLGGIRDLEERFKRHEFDEILIAIGYKHIRLRNELYHRFSENIPFSRIIHPHSWIDPSCSIGPGAVVYPGCVIDMHSTIGANTILNVGCVVAHHSSIESGCFLSPSVKIAGFVRVASGTVLGIGTVVIDNISITSGVRTGAGAVVVNDILEPGLYVGIPAKHKGGS